jgi:hypothetical protein
MAKNGIGAVKVGNQKTGRTKTVPTVAFCRFLSSSVILSKVKDLMTLKQAVLPGECPWLCSGCQGPVN